MLVRHRFSLLAALVAGLPTGALAQSFSTTPVGRLTVDGSVGFMSGASREYVYEVPGTGRVVSKLRWEFSNIGVVNAGVAYRPIDWMLLGLKATTNISAGGLMDDYDYNLVFCPPAPGGGTQCHSNHPDTQTQSVLMLDASLAARFAQVAGINVAAVAGYKRDTYKWQAFNGTSNYAGTFVDGLGISYNQMWEAPYLGLAFDGEWGKFGLSGRIVGSAWASGDDRDMHHKRSLLFTDSFGQSGYVGTDLGLTYQISSNVRFGIDYHYQRFFTAKGPTRIEDFQFGMGGFIPGPAAGGSSESHVLTAGLKINLQPAEQGGERGSLKDDGPRETSVRWAGLYAGASAGWLGQQSDWRTTGLLAPPIPPVAATANADLGADGAMTGLFGGYNWHRGHWVVGFEGDLSFTNANSTTIGIPGTRPAPLLISSADSVVHETGLDGSLRLRAGVLATPSLLLYGTAGLALQEVQVRMSCTAFVNWCFADHNQKVSKVLAGWTAGVGFEQMFADGWFVRGEYRYSDLGTLNVTAFADAPADVVTAKIDESNHRFTLGIGYRF